MAVPMAAATLPEQRQLLPEPQPQEPAAVLAPRHAGPALLGGGVLLAATACLLAVYNLIPRGEVREPGLDQYYEEGNLIPAPRRQALEIGGYKIRYPQPWPEKARPECRERLDRLEKLHAGQTKLAPGSTHDPDFPPNLQSIGGVGKCGDSAQGISQDCAKYNHWGTMQEVAKRYYRAFSVLKPGGVQYHDIGQGGLGTCYFLGALASIANNTPQLIEDMFVRRHLWKDNIFTTKWLIDEQETLIEVDGMLPASEDNVAFFVQPSSTGEFWPAILEKAYAKIHGSFHAIEGGFWPMPVMAITRAPVRTSYHKVGVRSHLRHWLTKYRQTSMDELWAQMVHATSNHHPMGASTAGAEDRPKKYGLASNHLYSVFRAYEKHPYGKVVDVFNPWNSDNYKGQIPNPDKTDGLFTMALAEFFDAFYSTYFAEVIPGYRPTSKRIMHGQESKWSHHNFQVKSVAPGASFFVSLTWPTHRLVHPCEMLDPDVHFEVVRGDEHGRLTSQSFHGVRDGKVINSLSAEVTSGPGNYHIMTNARFDSQNYIDDLVVSVYAPEDVHITEIAGISDGDRFSYGPWGTCLARWVGGELWMRSEAVQSTDGAKIWKTTEGGGQDLLDGRVVEVLWENSQKATAQLQGNSIVIQNDGQATHFVRTHPKPIPGSENWWTCQHHNIYTCGNVCCCQKYQWNANLQECRPI